jgi:hypothetical protein
VAGIVWCPCLDPTMDTNAFIQIGVRNDDELRTPTHNQTTPQSSSAAPIRFWNTWINSSVSQGVQMHVYHAL